ncbi:MAG: phosphate ABC transporter substrate-binding protein PstS [Nocardioides sp.]
MKTTLRRAIVPGAAALALAASLAACGDSNTNTAGDNAPADGGSALSGKLAGGGSSAQGTAQQAWMAAFQGDNSGVSITYDPVGSGTGRTSFESGAYSFAGSDAFIANPSDEYTTAQKTCGGDPIEVPSYISPIAVVFNLKGVDSLKLDAKTIADIFNGTVKKWNDPQIASQNDGVTLPDEAIHTVHRSDDSGTTQNFTEYLSKAGEGAWKDEPAQTWPSTDGLSGNGTSGVITSIKGGEGTIGYADASQAGGLGVVSIKVGSSYNAPSAEGAAAVVANSDLDASATDSQLIYDVNRTDTADGAYPLVLVSYLLACPTYADASTAAMVKGYLTYIVSQEGQQAGASAAGSAPLSSDTSDKATAILDKIAAK